MSCAPPAWLLEAHFGVVRDDGQAAPSTGLLDDDEDPDDELIETPPDVSMMLGFDPAVEFRESLNSDNEGTARVAKLAVKAGSSMSYTVGLGCAYCTPQAVEGLIFGGCDVADTV